MLVLADAAGWMARGALAHEFGGKIEELARGKVRALIADPALIEAVKPRNARTRGSSEDEIVKPDKQWRDDIGAMAGRCRCSAATPRLRSPRNRRRHRCRHVQRRSAGPCWPTWPPTSSVASARCWNG